MSATIKDVAKIANVSIATVSKYLNGGNVKTQNKLNIENAIKSLDYRVNTLARSLKTNKSMTIGIMVDNITNTFYTSIVSYIEDKLSALGYSTIICDTREDASLQEKKLEFLTNKGVDGIIVFTTNISAKLLNTYADRTYGIVVIDSIVDTLKCSYVTTDNIKGAYDAMDSLLVNGHKNIAIITGYEKDFSAKERLNGYKKALEHHNIEINNDMIFQGPYNINGGYSLFKDMLLKKELGISAVLIANYYMTIGAVIAINESNINIPNDLSIICFDDLELNKVFKPALSSVSQQLDEIGYNAIDILLEKINNPDFPSKVLKIPPKLTITKSIISR